MNIRLTTALLLGALFIAAPGCRSIRSEHIKPAHMHHRPGSNTRKTIHSHHAPAKDGGATEAKTSPSESGHLPQMDLKYGNTSSVQIL